MTFLRFASLATAVAFLATPALAQTKADPKGGGGGGAAGGDKSELYQQLNLFGDVLESASAATMSSRSRRSSSSRMPSTAC